ncbi:MAG: DUF4159 domain-containing protein [Candidatus Eisenbacteria bacterium]
MRRDFAPHRRFALGRWLSGVAAASGLILAVLLLGLPLESSAQDGPPGPGFSIARLRYGGGGDWYSNPSSLPNLADAVRRRTSVPVDRMDETAVSILDPDFFNYPFLYMNGHGTVKWTESEANRLRKYLLAGGFLFADDNYGMDESFRREIQKVFPDHPLVEVPWTHPIYSCFYRLPQGPPKVHEHDGKPSQGFGIFDGDRLMVFYTYQADIGDGLEDPQVHKDPEEVREAAMQMAVNTVVYAMTH